MSSNAFMTVGFVSFFSVSKCSCLPKDSIMKKDKSATTAWELCSSLILPVIVLQVMTDPFVPITDNLYLSSLGFSILGFKTTNVRCILHGTQHK